MGGRGGRNARLRLEDHVIIREMRASSSAYDSFKEGGLCRHHGWDRQLVGTEREGWHDGYPDEFRCKLYKMMLPGKAFLSDLISIFTSIFSREAGLPAGFGGDQSRSP